MAAYCKFQFGSPLRGDGNRRRILAGILLFLSVLIASASAQDRLSTDPVPAATGPGNDVNLGYIFHTLAIPGAGEVTLYGLNVGGDMELRERWAATIDSSYIRTSNVDGTEHGGNVVSLLLGPTFYCVENQDMRLFVHVLGGPALANSSASSNDAPSQAWAARFGYAIGGGFEHSLSAGFALRINADYVGKPYVGSPDVVGTVSLVYHLPQHVH
jgi:hypothetical protein